MKQWIVYVLYGILRCGIGPLHDLYLISKKPHIHLFNYIRTRNTIFFMSEYQTKTQFWIAKENVYGLPTMRKMKNTYKMIAPKQKKINVSL
jgi:hypothetical protein